MKQLLLIILFPFILFGQSQIGQDIDGEAAGDNLTAVALSADGSILAVGTPFNEFNGDVYGLVKVFERINNSWIALGQDLRSDELYHRYGYDVSLSSDGNVLALSTFFNSTVKIYQYSSNIWTQFGQDIEHINIDATLGKLSLSADGLTVAIGDRGPYTHGYPAPGISRIFRNISGSWTQLGSDLVGDVGSHSGYSIDLSSDGNTVAIGADRADVKVFQFQSENWVQQGSNIPFGNSVSLSFDGLTIAIGDANNSDGGTQSGLARIYKFESGSWVQIGADIDGDSSYDFTGRSVSISSDGSTVAISFDGKDDNGDNSGQVRIYKNISGSWAQIGLNIDGEEVGDRSGWNLSLSSDGSTVAIAAPFNDDNGTDSGHVRVYDLSSTLSYNDFVLSKFSLFPNPTKNQFTIQLQEGLELQIVNIYNSLGQLIKSTNNNVINTSELSTGIYYVEIITNKGKATKKIVIK